MIQRLSKSIRNQTCHPPEEGWNSLWTRSGDAIPLARQESLQSYIDGFGNGSTRLLVTGDQLHPSAGLALTPGRKWKLFRQNHSPNNAWMQTGALLIDRQLATTESIRDLAAQIRDLCGSFVTLDWADNTDGIQQLMDELKKAGCYCIQEEQLTTGFIKLEGDWETFFAKRSKGFRKKVRAGMRKLNEVGEVGFERHAEFRSREHLESLVDAALEIEDLSWKGRNGSSLNSNPVPRSVFLKTLADLADDGFLEIQFLTVNGRRIAFDIGFRAHQTYYSYKISFDPEFARFSPGQLLTYLQVREWFANGQVKVVDTIAELTEATGKWCDQVKTRYRFIVATRFHSILLLRLYERLKPVAKRLLGRN